MNYNTCRRIRISINFPSIKKWRKREERPLADSICFWLYFRKMKWKLLPWENKKMENELTDGSSKDFRTREYQWLEYCNMCTYNPHPLPSNLRTCKQQKHYPGLLHHHGNHYSVLAISLDISKPWEEIPIFYCTVSSIEDDT